jgi:hypothetical protein
MNEHLIEISVTALLCLGACLLVTSSVLLGMRMGRRSK